MSTPTIHYQLGRKIASLRVLKDKTQEQLALIAGMDQSELSKIERGAKPGVTLKTIFKIAKALEIKPKDLIDFDN